MNALKKFLNKKVIIIALAALLIAAVASVSVYISASNNNVFSTAFSAMIKPVKKTVADIADSFERLYGYMYKYDKLVLENSELKDKVADLEQEYREYTEISNENARLRKLLDLKERHSDLKMETATLISWSASNWSSSFSISKGSNYGIEVGDCVITENGYVVGQVTEVDAGSSIVTTILDPSLGIGAFVYETSIACVVQGDITYLQDGLTKLSYYEDGAALASGYTLTTSGKGGMFPPDLILGYVSEVITDSTGSITSATVKPAVDFVNLAHLYVVTSFDINE